MVFPTEEIAKRFAKGYAATADAYPYERGHLFLGKVPVRGGEEEIGIQTKRHAITIAGARSGKGVSVIIPNLLRWPHNALVIDPKGEAAEATAETREAMGQAVYVLDPFGESNVPDRFKARFNPLAGLDASSPRIREDIEVIVDGLVMRNDPKAAHWDGGAASVIAGLIAYIVDQAAPEQRTLPELRRLLTLPDSAFATLIDDIAQNTSCGNLPATAAARLTRSGSEAGHFLSNADENTKWLDSVAIAKVLQNSTFDLADLKRKPMTVFLVLPADLVGVHGRFLRLFVRSALNAMARGGAKSDARQCLFLLDEFYALGRIDEIAKAAGLMPGYGVKLWPFLQDINQLVTLYGSEGAGTFFGNADLHQFFGNTDRQTLEYAAHRIGAKTVDEIPLPPAAPMMGGGGHSVVGAITAHSRDNVIRGTGAAWAAVSGALGGALAAADQARYQDEMAEYQRHMATVGKPRIPPDQVAALVQLKDDIVADGMLCFVFGSELLYVHPSPFFRPLEEPPAAPVSNKATAGFSNIVDVAGAVFFTCIMFVILSGVVAVVLGGSADQKTDFHKAVTFGLLLWWFWGRVRKPLDRLLPGERHLAKIVQPLIPTAWRSG